jgi:hypothetical protein
MVFRLIYQYLVRNDRIVSKLADSRPVRQVARWVVYLFIQSNASEKFAKFKQGLKGIHNHIKKGPSK